MKFPNICKYIGPKVMHLNTFTAYPTRYRRPLGGAVRVEPGDLIWVYRPNDHPYHDEVLCLSLEDLFFGTIPLNAAYRWRAASRYFSFLHIQHLETLDGKILTSPIDAV